MSKRILCYGDSNTWGAIPGLSERDRFPEDVRWTGVLGKILGDDYTIIEEGHCGRTTVFDDPVEGRLSGLTYFAPCIASQSPLDLIIIMLGTNDLKRKFQVGALSSAFGLKWYLDTIKAIPRAGEDPKVLIVAPMIVEQDYKSIPMFVEMYGDLTEEDSAAYGPAYKAFAEENGLEFLNAAEIVKADPADGIHMGADGHAKFAAAVAEKVKEIIG